MPHSSTRRGRIIAWALYDWANSAYAVVVLAGFFPIFFKQYWDSGASAEESTWHLGLTNSVSSLLVVLAAPIIGAIADQLPRKNSMLLLFAANGVAFTAAMYLVGQGQWHLASLMFIASYLGWAGGNIIYDSMLVDVSEEHNVDKVSAIGFALGYLGGGLLFTVNVLMTLHPDWFGLSDKAQAVRWSFLSVGIWWAVFSIPILKLGIEPVTSKPATPMMQVTGQAFRQLWNTFREIRNLREVFLFLLAYWLYIDGVDTIIRMAVDYGLALGFGSDGLIKALLITQFVGFPAAWLYGIFGQKIGAKKGILLAIGAYIVITIAATDMQSVADFYFLAVTIGLVQGGIQALSRSMFTRLIPPEKSAEFFGFYNMLGKFAAVLGPILVGWSSLLLGNRLGILSIAVLLLVGGAILLMVNEEEGARLARRL